jgi:hypothetical protein
MRGLSPHTAWVSAIDALRDPAADAARVLMSVMPGPALRAYAHCAPDRGSIPRPQPAAGGESNHHISFDGVVILPSGTVKWIGVWTDSKLTGA